MARTIEDFVKNKLKLQKEKYELEKRKNYAKTYYKEYSTSARGKEMIVVVTEEGMYNYVSTDSDVNAYDLAACLISGAKNTVVEADNSLRNLSRAYNSIIVHATPPINEQGTTIYVPQTLNEYQKAELENFERQVEEHNAKYSDKVVIKKVSIINDDIKDVDFNNPGMGM